MTVVKTVLVSVVKRAWHDLEPKVLAFLATGLTATILITGADYVGIKLDPGLAGVIVLIVGGLAGYLKSSTSKAAIVDGAVTPAVGE